jgi:hypothetical protein
MKGRFVLTGKFVAGWTPVRYASATGFLVVATAFVGPARAAGGAYLVDDASITPAGHCQLESWFQALSGGQSLLAVNPACTTGAVEWTLGLASQAHPTLRQAAPAVKWMLRDPDTHGWGLALQANVTYGNGHALTQSAYAAATVGLDAARRWSLNTEVGATRLQGSTWRPLAGAGVEFRLAAAVTLLAEHLWSPQGPSVSQAGVRWLLGDNSIDLIAGHSSAQTHDRWVTLGFNLAF